MYPSSSRKRHTSSRPLDTLNSASSVQGSIFSFGYDPEEPIEIDDDSPPEFRDVKRKKTESAQPISSWKPLQRSSTTTHNSTSQHRALAPKPHAAGINGQAKPPPLFDTYAEKTTLSSSNTKSGSYATSESVKKSTAQRRPRQPLDSMTRNFEGMIKQIQVQNSTIKGLERKVDQMTVVALKEIQDLLRGVKEKQDEQREERRAMLETLRDIMRHINKVLLPQENVSNYKERGDVALATVQHQFAPSFVQPPLAPNPLALSTMGIETNNNLFANLFADPNIPVLPEGDFWNANSIKQLSVPMQRDTSGQSMISTYTSDDDWYSAQDGSTEANMDFGLADDQLRVLLQALTENPNFDQYASTIQPNSLRANPKRRERPEYWQTSVDGINSFPIAQPAVPGANPFYAPSVTSLSTGVETLPSDCTRESSVAYTDNASGTARSLRTRTKQPDYVGHPMDQLKKDLKQKGRSSTERREGEQSSSSGGTSESGRQVRGRSACLSEAILAPSNGKKSTTGAVWPDKGPNTVRGRMQDVQCEPCKGRAHVACAGFDDKTELQRQPWSCPECQLTLDNSEDETVPPIDQAQQERCLRPNCIVRSRLKVERKHRDEDEFFIECIVGRTRVTPAGRSKHVYEYLIKWTGYPVYESTWEPATNVQDLEFWRDHFLSKAKAEHLDLTRKFVMLKETEEYFDSKGQRDEEKLENEGVEPKDWWY